jgi:hypothetical protein
MYCFYSYYYLYYNYFISTFITTKLLYLETVVDAGIYLLLGFVSILITICIVTI